MTKNKKKLRRLERLAGSADTCSRARNTNGIATGIATGLAAGALLGGLMLVAPATAQATTEWDKDKDITISADETVSAETFAKSLNITNGTLTFTPSTANTALRLTEGTTAVFTVGASGKYSSSGGVVLGIANGAEGGLYKTDTYYGTGNIAGNVTLTSGGAIQLDTINITGGAHSLSGSFNLSNRPVHKDKGKWRMGSQIYAGHALTLKDTTVTLNAYGLLGVGSTKTVTSEQQHLTIGEGATVVMTGSGTSNASGAAVLRAHKTSGAEINVLKGGTVNVSGGYGVIASNTTTVDGGKIAVASDGRLEMVDVLKDTTNDEAWQSGSSDAGSVVYTGGTLNLKNAGRLLAESGSFTGGTINIDGAVSGARSGIYGVAGGDTGTYTFGGATAADLTVNVANGGGIEGVSITLSSGNYTVSGIKKHTNLQADWRQGSLILGGKALTIVSGATVNVKDSGILAVDNVDSTNSGMSVNGTVNLGGSTADKAGLMIAFTSGMSSTVSGIAAAGLDVSGGNVTVAANQYGRMVAAETKVTDSGSINVAQGGKLLISQGYNETSAELTTLAGATTAKPLQLGTLAGTFGNEALKVYNTELNISGGIVNVSGDALIQYDSADSGAGAGSASSITLAAADSKLNVTGNLTLDDGSLTMSHAGAVTNVGGTLINKAATGAKSDDLGSSGSLFMGALQLKDAESTFTANGDVGVTFTGLGEGKSIFNGKSITVSGDTLTLAGKGGAYNGTSQNMVIDNTQTSTLAVNGGNWNIGTLQVSGAAGSGNLTVDAGHLTIGSLTATDTDRLSGSTVATGAGLTLKLEDVAVKDASGKWTSGGKVLNSGDGVTVINGTLELLASGTLTRTEIDAIKTGIGFTSSDTGLISFTGADIDATDYKTNSSDAALKDTVDVTAGAGNLFKEDALGASGSTNSANVEVAGIGGDSLVVKDTSTGNTPAIDSTVTVTADKALTLIGANGELVKVVDASGNSTGATVTVAVGSGGALNLGNITAKAGAGTVDVVALDSGAGLNATNGNYTVGELTTADSSSVGSVTGGATLTIASADLSAGGVDMTVGNAGGQGTLIIKEGVDLNGSTFFLDPAWQDGKEITDASKMFIASDKLTAKVTAGQNSWFMLGSEDEAWAVDQFKNSGLVWGENAITAAAVVFKPITLDDTNGGLLVDGSLTANEAAVANTVEFRDNSLLMVNAGNLNGKAAITSTAGLIDVDGGSKLLLANASVGDVTILDGFTSGGSAGLGATDTGWANGNLLTSSYLLEAQRGDLAAGELNVKVKQKSVTEVLPGISNGMGGLLDSMYSQGLNDVTSSNAGIRFASRATDSEYLGIADTVKVLEGAAQVAQAGGAPGASITAGAAAVGAMAQRTNMTTPVASSSPVATGANGGAEMDSGLGVWAMPLYQHEKVSGMKAGQFNTGYTSDLFGGIIGLDTTTDLFNGQFRLGAAFNVGTADIKSKGDFNTTKNDMDFWGASLYAGWRYDMFALSTDFGYTASKSDIKQDLPSSLDMGSQLKSKVDGHLYSAGVKAEYKIPTEIVDITPNVAVRYSHYKQDAFNVSGRDGDVFNIDKSDMSTWTFPIGVTLSRDFDVDGWQVSPQLDLHYIPAAGDLKIQQTSRIPGMPINAASLKSEVIDRNTGEVGLGVGVRKDAVSFDLNYNYQGSANRDAHGVQAAFRYEF